MISLTIGRRKEVILPVCRWANSFRYSRFLKRKAIIIIIAFRFRNLSSSSFLLLYVRLVCCCPSVLFEVCLLILLLRFYFPSEVFVSDSFVDQGTNRDSKEISHSIRKNTRRVRVDLIESIAKKRVKSLENLATVTYQKRKFTSRNKRSADLLTTIIVTKRLVTKKGALPARHPIQRRID